MDASLVLRVVVFGLYIFLGLVYVWLGWCPSTTIDSHVQSLCHLNLRLVERSP